MRLPTVIIRDVLNSDEDIVGSLRTKIDTYQGLGGTRLYHRLIKPALYTWGSKAPVWDQSPLVQCSRCLGYGHGKRFAKKCPRCAHCGGEHWHVCRARDGSPKMRKLHKGRLRGHRTGHSAQVRGPSKMGYGSVEGGVLAAGALAARPHTYGRGSSTEGCTDRVSLRFMQSNLQRRTLYWEYWRAETVPGCRVVQRRLRGGPVKAAIMVLSSDVDVEEDQTLNGENVAAAVIKAGNCRIGVVSVYFEETCPSARTSIACDTSAQNSGPTKSSWGRCQRVGVWWGSERNDARGDRLLKSVVDVTACSSALLDRAEGWQVVRDVTSSDHNAVTFAVGGGTIRPSPLSGTRVYNTAKARWSEFAAAMDAALNERTLTTEMVKSVGSCDQLDEVVETYTECIRQACDAAIPRKSSNTRGLKPLVESRVRGLKRDARTKKRRIRNAAPAGGVRGWESLWDGIYRVIRETGKNREDVLLKTDSGQVIGPDESATLLAETFFPDDRVDTDDPYHTEVRRRTDGSSQPPEASGDLPGVDPPFTGAEVIPKPGKEDYARPKSYRPIGLLLCWAKQWKGCWSAPPVALNAKTSGDAVWLHAAARTEDALMI
ncbi:hypothetical protein EVAR_19131_1 [Eumeta japonica]|uniref:Endonuclease/exonuclease/phosphatase domain-containing protein n=1 Tax=Eumeta variegata TaxID=151549 RepID=A0A4C1SPM6_EUMVA|nr:hypothetical protein EVAR_19131_1 [Eumeta japonica]